jgi:hypothetical protein
MRTRRSSLALATLALTACCALPAVAGIGPPSFEHIGVSPANPDSDDFVKIQMRFTSDDLWEVTESSRDGNRLFITMEYRCAIICSVEEVELDVPFGELPAGDYRVYINDTNAYQFSVTEAGPPPEEESWPRVDLAISPQVATDNDRVHALIPIHLRSCTEPALRSIERLGTNLHRVRVDLPADDPDSECGTRLTAVIADLGQLEPGAHTAQVVTHVEGGPSAGSLAAMETFAVANAADAVTVLDRYRLSIDWTTPDGVRGSAHPVAQSSEASALFTFFDRTNWEVMVKVLDGCAINGHRWVFLAAATDVEFDLTVEDLEGVEDDYTYHSNPGSYTPPLTDTSAIPCGR